MEKGVTITTRLASKAVREIDEIAQKEDVDRSTIVRKFVMKSIKEWIIEKSLEDYQVGRITLWQAAKKSDITLWEMIDEVRKRSIHVPYIIDDLKDDLKVI
jgi:predicted HTH domain antitoxin